MFRNVLKLFFKHKPRRNSGTSRANLGATPVLLCRCYVKFGIVGYAEYSAHPRAMRPGVGLAKKKSRIPALLVAEPPEGTKHFECVETVTLIKYLQIVVN